MKIFGLICMFTGWGLAKIQFGSRQDAKPATFDRFDGSCPGHDVPITYDLNGIKIVGTKMMLNTTFTVKEDIPGDPVYLMVIQRCKTKENLDTCEPFQNFKANRYCSHVSSQSSLWKPFFGTYTPAWKCPISKGVYHGINSTLDAGALLLFSGESWFWRLNAELRQKRTNRLLMCMFIDAYVTFR